MTYKYHHVVLGGTFDLLHKGHISLIEKAFKISRLVSIGITTDKFCKKLGKSHYESQAERRKNLTNYLKSHHQAKRVKIVWLNDIYGTTINDRTIEAIIVSKETLSGARKINEKRTKNKLKKLKIIAVAQVLAQDGKKISTGRIKSGEISKEGVSYYQLLLKIAGKRFANKVRKNFKKPFGKVVKITKKTKYTRPLISVGDVSTQKLLRNNIVPDIAIVDFYVNRQKVYQNLMQLGFNQPNPDYIVKNIPGQISKGLIETVQKALCSSNRNQIIQVNGEEDLAFIPALLLTSIPSTIFYGQPNRGAVKIDVTTDAKNKLLSLIFV